MSRPVIPLLKDDTTISIFFKVVKYFSEDDVRQWCDTKYISHKLKIAERYVEFDLQF